jgi:hypothetical protein
MAKSAAVFIVGLLVWVPTLLVVSIARGPWFNGTELFGALGPVLALVVPGLIHAERGGTVAAIAVALAPILMLVGSFCSFFVTRAVFGPAYSVGGAFWGPLLTLALWAVPGLLFHFLLSNESPSEQAASDA